MILKRMKMEDWFIKTVSCRYNFSESGAPDFTLNEFLKEIKVNKSILDNIYLGNNSTWGSLELRKAISTLYQNVKPNNLIVTNGTSEALYIFFNLFLRPKSKILILSPAFPPLYLIPQSLNAKLYFFDVLKFKNKQEMLRNLILVIKKNKPDLLVINTPHNPTGLSFDKDEIVEIGWQARQTKASILFDEHYRFLPVNYPDFPLPSGYDIVSQFYKKVFAIGSIIKCVGIVGIRVGWLIADKITLNKVRDYKDYTTHCVSLVNETIAKLAIKNLTKITPGFIDRIRNNWLLLRNSELVKKKKIVLNYELEGGCVSFPKINGFNSLKLARILAERYNISVMPGEVFGKRGYIRLNFAQKTEDFSLLLDSLKRLY